MKKQPKQAKLKTQAEILDWFGAEEKTVHDVLERTDNRVFFRLYRTTKIFTFDPHRHTYHVSPLILALPKR
jgi:hypothetical protein